MINYLIELATVHVALFAGYWFFLRKENQYGFIRSYLIASAFLALAIPLLKFPRVFSFTQDQQVAVSMRALPLDAVYELPATTEPGWGDEHLVWIYIGISSLVLIKFLSDLVYLVWLRTTSRHVTSHGVSIRTAGNIRGSFTFFRWIFVSDRIDPQQRDFRIIVRHEAAHAALRHTYDLVFFELFKACFWWLPTAWIVLKEIKEIHEFQADRVAIKNCDIDTYSSVLISTALKTNGLNLASSFHDRLIHKRLKAMKQQSKNFNPWKIAALTAICTLLIVALACSEEKSVDNGHDEIFTIVESYPEFEGGVAALNTHIMKEITYPLVARKAGTEGRVDVQFVVDKDGTVSRVEALKGIGAGCDEEAVRVVRNLPRFRPAMQHGKPVRVRMVIPLVFQLKAGEANPDNSAQGMIIVGEMQARNYKLHAEAGYENGEWIGTVYDEGYEELPGAHIIIPGTTTGTVSAPDGSFKLKAESDKGLVVSFVGYETQILVSNEFDALSDPPENIKEIQDAVVGHTPKYREHQH